VGSCFYLPIYDGDFYWGVSCLDRLQFCDIVGRCGGREIIGILVLYFTPNNFDDSLPLGPSKIPIEISEKKSKCIIVHPKSMLSVMHPIYSPTKQGESYW
jgi:hypothetical protein